MNKSELQSGFYIYGNKGAVWNNKCHISQAGHSGTLCGTPALASNWARIEGIEEIGCEKCIKEYNDIISREHKS